MQWEAALYVKYIRLIRLNQNLVDCVWKDRPEPNTNVIEVQPLSYAGETWQSKIHALRERLVIDRCDAIVITSLTEIAYLLNLRGNDVPYAPVFKVSFAMIAKTKTHFSIQSVHLILGLLLVCRHISLYRTRIHICI